MRFLMIKALQGDGEKIMDLAERHGAKNLALIDALSDENKGNNGDKRDIIFASLSNRSTGSFISDLDEFDDTYITLFPHGVLPMSPPKTEVADQITDVEPRSPLEIWLNGLQSIGSWKGFLGYTISASVVVWIGMYTNTIYLLVAAMILAPFAGPAMNVAIGTASGDKTLLWRNILRYFAALSLTILITAGLSLVMNQQVATDTMVAVSRVSSIAALLPLMAGAAGALNLIQAESNSLVSGTAVGLLVAASLAPPAALIGMSVALGRWDMIQNGAFVLLLQLVGINLAGSLVFRAYGLKPEGERYEHGRPAIFYVSLGASAVILAALLAWQFSLSPDLQRSTIEQRAASEVQNIVEDNGLVNLVEANMRFTRPRGNGQNTLLGVLYVERLPGVRMPDEELRQELARTVQMHLLEQGFNVTPLISVNVLENIR